MSRSEPAGPAIAIVGMAVLLPGAPDLESYWRNLVNGVNAITSVPEGRWDATFYRPEAAREPARADAVYCRTGGFIDDLATVEVTRHGITPSSISGTEPDQLLALRVAASAIADAGGEERLPDLRRVGVILGRGGYLTPGLARLDQRLRTAHQLTRTLDELVPDLRCEQLEQIRSAFTEQLGPANPADAIGLVPNLAASRIANRLGMGGPAYTVDAACASSLIAIDQAVTELSSGRCDAVLAGGVHHCHDITLWSVFSQLRALSASGQIRPFDRAADGVLIGEGTGVVVLKRLADAERDGDRVYAVIRGTGIASDGRGSSLLHPDPDGQVLALERAWQAAGLDPGQPDSIGLLEAHGTATPAGDSAELTTLRRVFGGPAGTAVIGSVKSMIGHAMPAAGIAGLVKAALAVHQGVLLPTLHCDDPHPALADTRFRPLARAQPWPLGKQRLPRRAAVNAFGFGGINAHVVLEQWKSTTDRSTPATRDTNRHSVKVAEPDKVLRLSATSPDEMADVLAADDSALLAPDPASPQAGGCRLGIVDPTPRRLALARRIVAKSLPWRGRHDVWFTPQPLLPGPKGGVAFLFPGLEAEFAPRVDDVADRLDLPRPDVSTGGLGSHATSVLRVGLLLDAAMRQLDVIPDALAGHSVGEWTAMIAGGIYAVTDVDRLLEHADPHTLRVPGVEFAALGCGVEQVSEMLGEYPDIVVSHENSPRQTILCGPAEPVTELLRVMRARNIVGQILPFRSGFHTPMLRPYLAPLRSAVDSLPVHRPVIPVWSATTASPYPHGETAVRELYLRHLLEPVRFRSLVRSLYASGIRAFIQMGPGQLGSLVDDTLSDVEHLTVAANSAQRDGLDQLRRAATALWTDGAEPSFDALAPNSHQLLTKPDRHTPVRLDLRSPLVSLRTQHRVRLSDEQSDSLQELSRLSHQFPEIAELSSLLNETAEAGIAVIRAQKPQEAAHHLRFSLDTMPYLRDHCFAAQRADWPDDTDRRPVVPATTLVQHMIDAAEQAATGSRAVEVHDVRLTRWLVVAPPVDVTIRVTPAQRGRVHVTVGEYARATVVLDTNYPSEASQAWPVAAERPPTLTAEQFYRERWMFHGPSFQGITELIGVGDHHARATVTVPPAPGGLLDNVGQLLGHWIIETQHSDRIAFPIHIDRLRFFATEPKPGTQMACLIRLTSISRSRIVFDAQITRQGRIWAEITGWHDQRFDSAPDTEPAYRQPERNTLSSQQSGGWVMVPDRWTSLAARDLYRHKYLNASERQTYEVLPAPRQRSWLLGRIAVKDAVRRALWDRGWGPVFPAEVLVHDDDAGRPTVIGLYGLRLPRIDVSLAHCHELGVAMAVPSWNRTGPSPGVGIDIEEITQHPHSTIDLALSGDESALLAELSQATAALRDLWFTRFWSAKEAVSKAVGTGLRGQPRQFVVLHAQPTRLLVRAQSEHGIPAVYDVHCTVVHNPQGLPNRHYVVAWTTETTEAEAIQ